METWSPGCVPTAMQARLWRSGIAKNVGIVAAIHATPLKSKRQNLRSADTFVRSLGLARGILACAQDQTPLWPCEDPASCMLACSHAHPWPSAYFGALTFYYLPDRFLPWYAAISLSLAMLGCLYCGLPLGLTKPKSWLLRFKKGINQKWYVFIVHLPSSFQVNT